MNSLINDENFDEVRIILNKKNWLEKAVIGLNLCPFAKAVHVKQQIRYVVTNVIELHELVDVVQAELEFLLEANPNEVETTLLIMPNVLSDFLDFNDFLDVADNLLSELDAQGIVQIASFHPLYQFAGTKTDDIENYTNRAPYPTLHLLRETSIDRAVESYPDTDDIFQKNIATLAQLGLRGWQALMAEK